MTETNELTFEEAMKKLEEIVGKLETGDVPLEQAIAYYQKGIEYSKICNDKLQNVQEKMTTILNEQGELEPFEIQED
ncbi:MAG TPA: exodeoxyribonuclease VII small subunit [Bacillota bacterium]|nr:exodeoxyribonuclease VII small subunit [Bacillota bacterium]